MLLLLALACTKTQPPVPTAPTAPVTLTIVGINDFHGALYETPDRKDPTRAQGGLPWLVGAIDALRAEDPDLVVLDGGDVFQGAWPVNQTEGRGSVEAFHLLGVDAAAVGNHEFDYGGLDDGTGDPLRGALEAAAAKAEFAWLSANLRKDGQPWTPAGIEPWTVIERKGVKLGVIGLTTTDTPQTTLKKNVADLEFADVVEATRAAMADMPEVDALAVVGHLTGGCEPAGYYDPGPPCDIEGEVGALLKEIPEIDVIVSGHFHTIMAWRIGDTFVMQNRARGHAIGRVDLVIGPDGVDADASVIHKPWPIEHTAVDPGCGEGTYDASPQLLGDVEVTPSADALALIGRLEQEAGSLCEELTCSESVVGRSREEGSALGDLVSDAMLDTFEGADLAITNSGGLRADLPAGAVRREHVQSVMPFDNRLLLIEMTGAQVEHMLQIGSSGAHGILQLAGGTYAFDPAATEGTDQDGDGAVDTWERDRLCAATVGGEAIDPQRSYKVVTTDFLFDGGDHLGPAFEGATVLEEGPLLREHLFSWFANRSGCVTVPEGAGSRVQLGTCPTP